MNPEIPRLERGPFLALLDEAVSVARGVFRPIFLPVAVPPALAAGLMALAQATAMRRLFHFSPGSSQPEIGGFLVGMGLTYAMLFLFTMVRLLAAAAMFAGAGWYLQGEPVSAGRVWRWALRGRTVGTILLVGLFVGIGFMFCGLPGIYLAVIYAVAVPVLLWENPRASRAPGRSRELIIHDNAKRLFSPGMGWVVMVWITTVVLTWGVGMAVQLPLTIVQQILTMRHIMGQAEQQAAANFQNIFPAWLVGAQVIVTALSTLAQQLVALFSASAFTLLYLRLRGRKEGTDLAAALDRLGAPA